MKIQYMSDLHMELWDNSQFIQANEFEAKGDILVLAGDTFYLRDIVAPQKRLWNWASKNFQQVLLVPGNHEFYSNGDVTARGDSWQWMIRKNIGYAIITTRWCTSMILTLSSLPCGREFQRPTCISFREA